MKRAFHFRLARVLRLRALAERSALVVWAGAEHAASSAERLSVELRQRVDRAQAETAGFQQNPALGPRAILVSDRVVQRLWRTLRRRRATARDLRATAEAERGRWSERSRDRRALERLLERKRAAHRAELAAHDAAELDEWASRRRGPDRG